MRGAHLVHAAQKGEILVLPPIINPFVASQPYVKLPVATGDLSERFRDTVTRSMEEIEPKIFEKGPLAVFDLIHAHDDSENITLAYYPNKNMWFPYEPDNHVMGAQLLLASREEIPLRNQQQRVNRAEPIGMLYRVPVGGPPTRVPHRDYIEAVGWIDNPIGPNSYNQGLARAELMKALPSKITQKALDQIESSVA